MSKTKHSTTPAEAAQILLSAVKYCIEAGVNVKTVPAEAGRLVLEFNGLVLFEQDGKHLFVPAAAEVPAAEV